MTSDLSKMTRRSKKSADVTLVYNEDMIPKGQEVILNVDYNLLNNVHDDELPAGWKLTKQLEQSYNWVEGEGKEKTLPHYLNAGKKSLKDCFLLQWSSRMLKSSTSNIFSLHSEI